MQLLFFFVTQKIKENECAWWYSHVIKNDIELPVVLYSLHRNLLSHLQTVTYVGVNIDKIILIKKI